MPYPLIMPRINSLYFYSLMLLHVSDNLVYTQDVTLEYKVREEQDERTFIGNVARDSLLYGNVSNEMFQRMKFSILTQGNEYASLFTIDETTSTLRTAKVLDRESICANSKTCNLGFNVAVYIKNPDSENFDIYKIIRIFVTVEDINDNKPTFPNSEITLEVSESAPVGYELFTRGAIDRDTGGNNSVQAYKMNPSKEIFGLKVLIDGDGTSDLAIVLHYPLDRETRDFYQLTIEATDGGFPQRTGTLTVNITVTDTNDNPPLFTQNTYNITLPENSKLSTQILTLSATDADIGENARISYMFSNRVASKIKDLFAINETTGNVSVIGDVDFEVDHRFQFSVQAVDHGNPFKFSIATVLISVLDMNDNAPEININVPPGGTKITEAAEVGAFVAHVGVTDLDSGINGKCTCRIAGDNFRLEEFGIENNYKVVLNKRLDYEVATRHNVTIICEDGGVPKKENRTSFIVMVEDVNDNFPQFTTPSYYASIRENQMPGPKIVQVLAVDVDSGENGRLLYALHPEAISLFTINPQTGLISANFKFDREKTPEIRFRVAAFDQGDPSLTSTATVVLTVLDENDNAPQFQSNPLYLSVLENRKKEPVGFVNVTDPDAQENGQFDLIFPSNPQLINLFYFDSKSGYIETKESLDREQVSFYEFTVSAVDRGAIPLSSTARVIIRVIDDNDQIPAILYPNNGNNTVVVPVNSPVGQIITRIEATDNDEGRNAKLLYNIQRGDVKGLFSIDVDSGILTVGKPMNIHDVDTYRLSIAVQDKGDNPLTGIATLIIVVAHSNDTAALPLREEEGQQNILIVIILVLVTVILSVAIIITICVIRRIDRGNRNEPIRKIVEEPRMYEHAKTEESVSASSNMSKDSKDSDMELLKKKIKKEVSFSLEEESDIWNNSSLTNVTSFSTFKNPTSFNSSTDCKDTEDPQSSRSWLENNTLTSSDFNKTDSYTDKEISSLTQHQLQVLQHQRLPRVHEGDEYQVMALETLKKTEDANSETSVECGTSDSGRGGSDEDINSNKGHMISDSEESKVLYPTSSRSFNASNHTPQHLNIHASPSHNSPRSRTPADSFKRNISFSDDSVTANTTVNSKYSLGQPSPGRTSNNYIISPHRNNITRELFFISGRTHGSNLFDSQNTTGGLPYSLADINDVSQMMYTARDDVSEMTYTTRDDISTTTSGSYTINPDELCQEIDELFFKDIVV
ncbi:hypothetical protein CHS0354_004222 [Potamilus streckersoni]|uniref:Cadherin domain-containing protein n=1 Tax=Potamilus streckersoni TaxID=2493646 RepID=A0AAE0RRS6_9BIVA|nr:hypothetical protein CHS0354_004222 [Potamilus streckersoni]